MQNRLLPSKKIHCLQWTTIR